MRLQIFIYLHFPDRNTKYNSTIASDILQCNIVNKYKDNEDNELEPNM